MPGSTASRHQEGGVEVCAPSRARHIAGSVCRGTSPTHRGAPDARHPGVVDEGRRTGPAAAARAAHVRRFGEGRRRRPLAPSFPGPLVDPVARRRQDDGSRPSAPRRAGRREGPMPSGVCPPPVTSAVRPERSAKRRAEFAEGRHGRLRGISSRDLPRHSAPGAGGALPSPHVDARRPPRRVRCARRARRISTAGSCGTAARAPALNAQPPRSWPRAATEGRAKAYFEATLDLHERQRARLRGAPGRRACGRSR